MDVKKKIPAFTLMEVTIAMLIAAIAIAITYTAYRIISGTYTDYTTKQARIAAFTVSDHLLKKDFSNAEHITKTADGLDFQTPGGMITYQFRDSCLLRSQGALQTDTFKFPVSHVRLTFEMEDVQESADLDQLEYETQLEGQSVTLTYHKLYSSQNLFK